MMQVIAKAERVGDTVVLTLRERMDVFNAPLLMEEFDQLLEEGVLHFVVDLTAVRIVDADGDYPLLHLLKRTQAVGGTVILVCPVGNPVLVFYEMMRLDTLFEIVTSVDAAIGKVELSQERP